MTVKKIENGIVTWDGIYNKGYETLIKTFEGFLNNPNDEWTHESDLPKKP